MIGFPLPDRLDDCPVYWQNFVDSLPLQSVGRDGYFRMLEDQLRHNGARFRPGQDHEPGDFVIFDSEQQLTVFILRWS
jgi:hypothetical protein